MSDDSSLVNALLDALAAMVVENSALAHALQLAKELLPAPAQERLDKLVADLRADANLHERARRGFDELRHQSPDAAVQELLRRFPKLKDVN